MLHHASFEVAEIQQLLAYLGISSHYTGYRYAQEALLLLKEDENQLHAVTKCLYPSIAKRYSTSVSAVERNIRTLALVAFRGACGRLEQISGYPLEKRPTSSQFLAILYGHLILEK